MPKRMNVLAAASAVTLALGAPATRAADLPTFAAAPVPEPALATWSPWLVRVRALDEIAHCYGTQQRS